MSIQTIRIIGEEIANIISRPFDHEEFQQVLESITLKNPASPAPYLAMAIAFGLGHRDIDNFKKHLADAEKLLLRYPNPSLEYEVRFQKSLWEALHFELLLAEQKLNNNQVIGTEWKKQWEKNALGCKAALRKMKELLPMFQDIAIIKTITYALQAVSLSSEVEATEFQESVNALSTQFWAKEELQDLSGIFLYFSYRKSKNFNEAVRVGEKMVERNPNSLIAKTSLGTAYYFNKQTAAALKTYQQAIILAPKNAHVRLGYAKIAWRIGKTDEATLALNEVKRLDVSQKLTIPVKTLGHFIQTDKEFRINPRLRRFL